MIGSQNVSDELVKAMYELEFAAINYRKIYEKANGEEPLIYTNSAVTGDAFIITKGRYIPCIKDAVFNKNVDDMI